MRSNLVSILIPAYNAAPWVAETLESALAQTWRDKEVIVVDDGSRDETLAVVSRYESNVVKVVAQDNLGACAARNRAFELAEGEYIQWLDADDLLAPDKIERQMDEAVRVANPTILLTSAWTTFYASHRGARFSPDGLWRDLEAVDWLIARFSGNLWMNPAAWLVSRELAVRAGPWDTRLARDQDGEYICRVVSRSDGVRFVADAKSYYRQANPNSLSRALSDSACRSLLLGTSLSIGHLRGREDSDRTRAAACQLLQARVRYFYPDRTDLLRQANELARELGGVLSPPRQSRRYRAVKALVGRAAADRIAAALSNLKRLARAQHERLLLTLSRR